MSDELLYGTSEALIAVIMMVLLIAATEAGFRAGVKAHSKINEAAKSPVGIISGAILGLLALLLGFTFAMAQSRFELRQQLVMQESNNIGTTYLRSRLLPEPSRTEVARLLRPYVDARLDFYRAGQDQTRLQEVDNRTKELQNQLWSNVQTAIGKDDREVTTGLFIESLNETFDIQVTRRAAMENHVPEIVILLLFIVALVAVLGIGYECGLGGHRHLFTTTMMSLLIVLVIATIIDFDRPRRGIIRVKQNSMIRLQESLAKDTP